MLIFNDAYKLAQANKFIFEIPTAYKEVAIQGTTERTTVENKVKIFISAKLILKSDISDLDSEVAEDLVSLLNEATIETVSLPEFKEYVNEVVQVLKDLELEKTGSFSLTNSFSENDEDYSDDDDDDDDFEDDDDDDDDDFEEDDDEDEEIKSNCGKCNCSEKKVNEAELPDGIEEFLKAFVNEIKNQGDKQSRTVNIDISKYRK